MKTLTISHTVILMMAALAMTLSPAFSPETAWGTEYLVEWIAPAQQFTLSTPTSVAPNMLGGVAIADTGNSRITQVNINGALTRHVGSPGNAPGQFTAPAGVALDLNGFIYVADTGNGRIQKLDATGVVSAVWGSPGSGPGQFSAPAGVATDWNGFIYVADTGNSRIQKLSPTGAVSAVWGSPGSGPGQFNAPAGVAVDIFGYVFVADTGNNRVQKLDPSGAVSAVWGSPGSGPGQFSAPAGVAVDGGGNIYVADTGNSRVQKLDSTGAYLMTVGGPGNGPGQFNAPHGVAVDWNTIVYVADTGNNRVQKLYPMNSLTAVATGQGTGAVTATSGGIAFAYPATVSDTGLFYNGSVVTLTATADAGSLASWSGPCHAVGGNGTSQATCTFYSVASDTQVTAAFTPITYQLDSGVNPAGSGMVSPATGALYPAGSVVPVSVIPATGYAFVSWSGPVAASTNSTTTVTMSGPTTVTANLVGVPLLTAAIGGKSGKDAARRWPITITNTGKGAALGVKVTDIALKQTFGRPCRPAVWLPLPLLGDIAAGASATGFARINAGSCAGNARFTATVTYSANNGGGGSSTFINQSP